MIKKLIFLIFFLSTQLLFATAPPLTQDGWKDFKELTTKITRYDSNTKKAVSVDNTLSISYYDPYTKVATHIQPLVVFVDFSGARFGTNTPKSAQATYTDILGRLFTDTKNMKDYYAENSGGKFTIENNNGVTVYRLSLPYSCSSYTTEEMAALVCGYVKTSGLKDYFVNFDANTDGIIDALIIVHSAHPAEYGSDAPDPKIWSHKNNISGNGYVLNSTYKIIDYLMISYESPLGIFCHEFGHILGLPDLYNSSTGITTCGIWCLMDAGGWAGGAGHEGETPSHLSAWCKEFLGWSDVEALSGVNPNLSINPTEKIDSDISTKEAYRFNVAGTTEYFLLEYRDKTIGKYDVSLPGSGFLFWRINQDKITTAYSQTDTNYINVTPRAVELLEADGMAATFYGSASDLYPIGANKIEDPKLSNGASSGIFIYDFSGPVFSDINYAMTANVNFKEFYFYPNPFYEDKNSNLKFKFITTKILKNGEMFFYDLRGKEFCKYKITENPISFSDKNFVYDLDLTEILLGNNNLATGVYIAILKADDGSAKIVKKFAVLR